MKKTVAVLTAGLMSFMSLGIMNVYAEASVSAITADREAIYVDFSEKVTNANVELAKLLDGTAVDAVSAMTDADTLKISADLEIDTSYQLKIKLDGAEIVKNFKLNKILIDDFSTYADTQAMLENWFGCLGGNQSAEESTGIELVDGALVAEAARSVGALLFYPMSLYDGFIITLGNNIGKPILKSEYSKINDFVVEYDAKVVSIGLAPDIYTSIGAQPTNYGRSLSLPRWYNNKFSVYKDNTLQATGEIDQVGPATGDVYSVKTVAKGKDAVVNISVNGTALESKLTYTHTANMLPYFNIRLAGDIKLAIDNVKIYNFTDLGEVPDSISVTGYKVENPYLTEKVSKNKYIEIAFDAPIDVSDENFENISLTLDGEEQVFTTKASDDLMTLYINLPENTEWARDKKYVIKLTDFKDSTGLRTTSFERVFRWTTLLKDDFDYATNEELRENWIINNEELALSLDTERKAMIIPAANPLSIVHPKNYYSQTDWKDYYFEYEFAFVENKPMNESGYGLRYASLLTKNLLNSTGITFRRNGTFWNKGNEVKIDNATDNIDVEITNMANGSVVTTNFVGDTLYADKFYKMRVSSIDGVVETVFDRYNDANTPAGRLIRYSGTGIDKTLSGGIFFETELNRDLYVKNINVYKLEDITNISEDDNQQSVFEITEYYRRTNNLEGVKIKKLDDYDGDYVLLTAMYNADMTLKHIDIKEKEDLAVLDNLVVGNSAEIEINKTIPTDVKFIKIFLWNGWTEIKPLSSLYDIEM